MIVQNQKHQQEEDPAQYVEQVLPRVKSDFEAEDFRKHALPQQINRAELAWLLQTAIEIPWS